jgi:hypothetical protein
MGKKDKIYTAYYLEHQREIDLIKTDPNPEKDQNSLKQN